MANIRNFPLSLRAIRKLYLVLSGIIYPTNIVIMMLVYTQCSSSADTSLSFTGILSQLLQNRDAYCNQIQFQQSEIISSNMLISHGLLFVCPYSTGFYCSICIAPCEALVRNNILDKVTLEYMFSCWRTLKNSRQKKTDITM